MSSSLAKDRSQFYKDFALMFYGANRPGATVSQGILDQFWLQCMQAGLKNVYDCIKAFSETDFTEDETWLKPETVHPSEREGLSSLADRELEMIQAALSESHGRISGPSGAAAKLGIARQTLESKIRRLGIDKYGQKKPPTVK